MTTISWASYIKTVYKSNDSQTSLRALISNCILDLPHVTLEWAAYSLSYFGGFALKFRSRDGYPESFRVSSRYLQVNAENKSLQLRYSRLLPHLCQFNDHAITLNYSKLLTGCLNQPYIITSNSIDTYIIWVFHAFRRELVKQVFLYFSVFVPVYCDLSHCTMDQPTTGLLNWILLLPVQVFCRDHHYRRDHHHHYLPRRRVSKLLIYHCQLFKDGIYPVIYSKI